MTNRVSTDRDESTSINPPSEGSKNLIMTPDIRTTTALRCSAEGLARLMTGVESKHSANDVDLDRIRTSFDTQFGQDERNSLNRGLSTLSRDLVEAGLGGIEMLIEYKIPLTSKRIDVVLAGINKNTGYDLFVVVELKKWERAEPCADNQKLILVDDINTHPYLHPILQVRGYCNYLSDFVSTLRDKPDTVRGVAYLYNANDLDASILINAVEDDHIRLFTKDGRNQLIEYLSAQLAPVPGKAAADRLMGSAVRPPKQLMKAAAHELRNQDQFTLLAEQRLAYELVLHAAERARSTNQKEIVIVTGGPGSGKSAIALSLLAELSSRGYSAIHATGSRSFTETMRHHVARGSTRTKSMFKYFNSFVGTQHDELDVLICDEAHRIRETSVNRFTKVSARSNRPQLDELIMAAKVPVFLLDEHQIVRPGEVGTVADIKAHAEKLRLRVHQVDLDTQFRSGGSRAYEEWVLRLLGFGYGDPQPWTNNDQFGVLLAKSPYELEAVLRAKLDSGASARIMAGICWQWNDPKGDGTLVPDVQIGAWAKPWTVKGNRTVGGAPPSSLWATLPGGFEQVGSVYTAQGFEFDWNGVIFGPDLIYRNGKLVTVRTANRDLSIQRINDAQADRLIRNTYKVLLTRGLIGSVLYSTDPETQAYFASLVPHVGA